MIERQIVECPRCGHKIKSKQETIETSCKKCGKHILLNAEEYRKRRREYFRQVYPRNRQKILERQRKYYIEHREKCRRAVKEWAQKHREKTREYSRRWREKHPEHRKEIIRRRHQQENELRRRLKYQRIQLLGGKCELCGFNNPLALVFHHKNPEEKETDHDWAGEIFVPSRFMLLCANCHLIIHSEGTLID